MTCGESPVTSTILRNPEPEVIDNPSIARLVGATVLIVDDDVRNVFALTSALEMQGIEVLVMIHSWAPGTGGYPNGGVLERAQLLAKRKPGDPHPFVDPAAWTQYIKQAQVNAAKTLEQEKQKDAAAR